MAVAGLMRGRASARSIQLDIDIKQPMPPTIVSDPMRLQQIMLNLVSNAVKFTPQGGHIVLTLWADRAQAKTGRALHRVMFSVRDTGPGLTAEQIGRLFRLFSQAEPGTARRYGGSGLGLAISKRLAVLLGGDVTVQSTPGAGSEFVASIVSDLAAADAMSPAVPPAMLSLAPDGGGEMSAAEALLRSDRAASIGMPSPAVKVPTVQPPAIRLPARVLLAEDGEDNQRIITLFLQRAGADVTVCADGRAAVEAVQAAEAHGTPFALVLMDVQMPGASGRTCV
jgi:hypothetical protein